MKAIDALSGDIVLRSAELLSNEEKLGVYDSTNARDDSIIDKFVVLNQFEVENSNIRKSYTDTFTPLVKYIRLLKKKHQGKRTE